MDMPLDDADDEDVIRPVTPDLDPPLLFPDLCLTIARPSAHRLYHPPSRQLPPTSISLHQSYRSTENNYNVPHDYLKDNHTITMCDRTTLVGWLIELHHGLQLLPESLYLAVNMVDRFLFCDRTHLSNLQLVGAVCLWISAKYQNDTHLNQHACGRRPVTISALVRASASSFTAKQVSDTGVSCVV